MTWYSYFLLSVPEVFAMTVLTFSLIGIPIKRNIRNIILFSIIDGGISFTATIFMTNSLKPFITFLAYSLLIAIIFKMKLINGFIIGVITFICLILFELLFVVAYMNIFSLSYETLLASSWHRIFASTTTTVIPMLLLAFILKKTNFSIKMPLLFK